MDISHEINISKFDQEPSSKMIGIQNYVTQSKTHMNINKPQKPRPSKFGPARNEKYSNSSKSSFSSFSNTTPVEMPNLKNGGKKISSNSGVSHSHQSSIRNYPSHVPVATHNSGQSSKVKYHRQGTL